MMNKQKSQKAWKWTAVAFVPMLALLLMAFGQRGQNVVHKSLSAGKNQLDTLIAGKRLIIRDTTQYDASFIKGLKMSPGYEKIEVTDEDFYYNYRPNTKPDTLITYKCTIPTNLELNKAIVFSTRNKDTSLVLKRTNYTNIEYQVKHKKETIKAGTAILQSTFYLAAEIDHDENGKEIASEQYLNLTSDLDWAELVVEIHQAKIATITYCVDPKAKKYKTLYKILRE